METATAILDSCDSVFSQCGICTKKELFKIGFLVISFILGTADMVTDWKQWSLVGGYDQHYFIFIFQSTFPCAAAAGTVSLDDRNNSRDSQFLSVPSKAPEPVKGPVIKIQRNQNAACCQTEWD